ncbi:hypothetical protein [Vibrio sp. WXL210]|uniref:hypothetical protein n=1 Tax=Vibrio sp. WXL210 TaxID=3450709 RepID=UPI003EC85830
MDTKVTASGVFIFVTLNPLVWANDNNSTELYREVLNDLKWSDVQVDSSSGSITAIGMLGISGESLFNIENTKDITFAIQGISSNDSGVGFALSVTPARSSILPMSLVTYEKGNLYRLLGNLDLSYAQGDAQIKDINFERRAVSARTSIYLNAQTDDLILAIAHAVKEKDCVIDLGKKKGSNVKKLPTKGDSANKDSGSEIELDHKNARKQYDACVKKLKNEARWNASTFSIAYATGWIKPENGSYSQESLGHTMAANLLLGKDFPNKKQFALSVAYRYTVDEPILDTLATNDVKFKDTDLVTVKLIGGSNKFRISLEGSNTSSKDITASQRTFRYATAVEYRLYQNAWLNLKVGEQRTIEGQDREIGSLLSLSYSPTFSIDL